MASRYNISISHIAGSNNVANDFGSRNAVNCVDLGCQICKFISENEESVVKAVSISDFVNGNVKVPFSNRSAWYEIQQNCPELRRSHAHLTQGTRPSKKQKNICDVRRYLREIKVASDGLLVTIHKDINFKTNLMPNVDCLYAI